MALRYVNGSLSEQTSGLNDDDDDNASVYSARSGSGGRVFARLYRASARKARQESGGTHVRSSLFREKIR